MSLATPPCPRTHGRTANSYRQQWHLFSDNSTDRYLQRALPTMMGGVSAVSTQQQVVVCAQSGSLCYSLLAHTLQDCCLQSILLRPLHLQMFGFPKYLWREVALGQKIACIKHLFNEQTGKINGRTSWFAFLKNLMSWELLPGKVEFHQMGPNWEHLKTTEKIYVFPGSLQLHFSAVYNSEKILESGIQFVSFMFAKYSSFFPPLPKLLLAQCFYCDLWTSDVG